MIVETLAFLDVAGQTMLKLVPITIALGVVFAVLAHWSACNPGHPWWRKREIVTDVLYWFLIPLSTRFVRIGLMVMGAAYFYGIHGAQPLMDFYDDGFGPLAKMPIWLQAFTFVVVSDFLTYWIHRAYHRGALWKYHSVHHSSEELDWISAARFHPVNLLLGSVLVDVALLLAGISPNVMLWVGPFTTATSAMVHANLNWTLRPVQIRAGQSGFSPLAPHGARSRRLEQFLRHIPDLGHSVRHLLHAEKRIARQLWHRRQRIPGKFRRPAALPVPALNRRPTAR